MLEACFYTTCFAIIEDIFEINRGINSKKNMERKYLFQDLLDISVCPLRNISYICNMHMYISLYMYLYIYYFILISF